MRLFEVAFDGGIRGRTVFHCIEEGKAKVGAIVSCFDGCKPGGRDWVTGKGVVELDKSTDAGEVTRIGGLRRCHGGGHEKRHSCGGREVVGELSIRGSGV